MRWDSWRSANDPIKNWNAALWSLLQLSVSEPCDILTAARESVGGKEIMVWFCLLLPMAIIFAIINVWFLCCMFGLPSRRDFRIFCQAEWCRLCRIFSYSVQVSPGESKGLDWQRERGSPSRHRKEGEGPLTSGNVGPYVGQAGRKIWTQEDKG